MSDPFTDAWAEAEASVAPVDVFDTLELQHPAFVDDDGPFAVRAVNGVHDDQQFSLEDDAPMDAGEEVNFQAIPFFAERSEFSEGKTPECKVTIDGVDDEITPYLEDAVTLRADMIAIYRQYRADDLSAPCYGPIQFVLKQVEVSGTAITGTLKIDDLSNRKFPNKVYTYKEFPGLIAS